MKRPSLNMDSKMSSSSQNRSIHKAVFLDRDGVINKDSPAYIKSWSEFNFLPRSLAAIEQLTQNQFKIFVITNQSAVGRRMITLKTLNHIHTSMANEVVSSGGRIDDIFFCPHLPEDHCICRKPKPGLIHSAQTQHQIDLKRAYMVGDSAKDIECARRAGCGHALLVKTGNHEKASEILTSKGLAADFDANDLFEAVEWIIAHDNTH